MNFFSRTLLFLAIALLPTMGFAQGVTTGNFSGTVTSRDGEPMPGAVINALLEATGTRYSAVSREDGRWSIRNVKVGGPYTVNCVMTGFKTQEKKDIYVKLGEDLNLSFVMQLDTVEESLVVVAESNPLINPSKTGAASNVSLEALEALPTISRSIEDFARVNPFMTNTDNNGGANALQVAGRNNRYNNIQIDGAVNNDLFGLSASGAPGGQAEAQPISLEAIQELQLVIAPYDVRQGGFTGGGINAVTKSGTNTMKGSAFYLKRTDSWVGDIDVPEPPQLGALDEQQYGFSVGGPLIKDKLFYFVSADLRRREEPTGFGIYEEGTSGAGVNFGHYDSAVRFRNIMMSRYGFDPGSLEQQNRNTDSDNYFFRLDYNLNESTQVTFRHSIVDASKLQLFPNSGTYAFPSQSYTFPNKTNASVLQVNSNFGSIFNEFRLSYQTIKDQRDSQLGSIFPFVQIDTLDGTSDRFTAGTERFSAANTLNQDVLEITNDVTWFMGAHTLTIGTHNEFFGFENLFIRDNFGAYRFRNLDELELGHARSYDYSYSLTDNPKQAAKFDVMSLSLYVGDQWSVSPTFSTNFGIRFDKTIYPDDPTANPDFTEDFGKRTDEVPGNTAISPRIGFNWDINGDGKNQLRGGVGYFTGRTPYVWISNAYGNTGIEFARISVSPLNDAQLDSGLYIPFSPDPSAQPTSLPGLRVSTNEIDLTDPNFKSPQVLRTNLGYDRDLGFMGLIASAEVLYTKTVKDIQYQDLNLVATGNTTFGGRPTFTRVNTSYSNIIYLTNTDEGSNTEANIKVERPFQQGLYGFASYTWGHSESNNDGTSSQAVSNWRFNPTPGDPNNPALGPSIYEVEHRLQMVAAYNYKWGNGIATNASFFYNAQSGRPISFLYSSDVNGDGQTGNDLLYVPASADEVEIRNGTWADFNNYIEADEGLRNARGSIIEKNVSNAPWRHTLDFSLSQDVKINRYKFQLTLNITNFMNLLDKSAGLVKYAPNNTISPVRYLGLNSAGKPIYSLNAEVTDSSRDRGLAIDNLRSRYQGQLGLRFSF